MQKSTLLIFSLCSTIINTTSAENRATLTLLPVPQHIVLQEGKFRLTEDFTATIECPVEQRTYRATTRFLRRLAGRTGLFFPQDYITPESESDTAQLYIRVTRQGVLKLGEDESYSLSVNRERIYLKSETDIGALRGLETLLQLLTADKKGYFFPALTIEDAPRFPWRGLLIDVSRHFMPLEVLKRNIDGLAAVKMNVFHWHLTDDQGFRIECKTFPRLHEMGSDGDYYTQSQVKELIAYADERGIRVVPEFDMPAHTTCWLVGYPELGSAPGTYTIERHWGIKDPTMNPAREPTYQFLDKFLQEMAALFPDDFIHIGGDENNGVHWNANPEIQAFMQKNSIPDNHALQQYFNRRIADILTKYNKKMVGWDEILHPGLPKNIVIQSWRGQESLIESAQQGYQGLLSNGYYIDLIQPAEYHYLNDPIPKDSPLTAKQRKNILGGEATSWGELVTYETIDSRIWPRTAAIAERLWSPGEVRDVADMYRRLEVISIQLEELRLTHIKNYEMMLRRLCSDRNIEALKAFVDVVQPVKNYDRHFQGVTYTSYSPYTRVVDAARPESMTAREFHLAVERYLSYFRESDRTEIVQTLVMWKEHHHQLKPYFRQSPVLREIETMSTDLAAIAKIGLEAVNFIAGGNKGPERWVKRSLRKLEAAQEPRGQAELVIVKPIETLVQATTKIND